MTTTPIWQADRDNWSTTTSSEFHTDHPERFGPSEQDNLITVVAGDPTGWVTVPENGLSPDCEPVDGRCACGRSA